VAGKLMFINGNCAEAMTFYQSCVGGELILIRLRDTPMKEQYPEEKHNRIIYAQLKNNQIDFSATDWMASPMFLKETSNSMGIENPDVLKEPAQFRPDHFVCCSSFTHRGLEK
jgi:PhnB protein